MPFRLPNSYESITVNSADPTITSLSCYVDWLRRELIAAEAAFDAMNDEGKQPDRKPRKAKKNEKVPAG